MLTSQVFDKTLNGELSLHQQAIHVNSDLDRGWPFVLIDQKVSKLEKD